MDDLTNLGLIPYIWLIPAAGLTFALLGIVGMKYGNGEYGPNGIGITGILFLVAGGIGLLIGGIFAVPYDAKYWSYYEVSGPLNEVSNRFENATGDSSSGASYPARIGDLQVVMYDSRIFNYSVGDEVNLRCSVKWIYQGQDQLNCVIRSY